MSTIIYTKIKGTTYCYRSESYWDKESKTPKSKRTLIGKIDPETGEMVPTRPRGRRKCEDDGSQQQKAKEALITAIPQDDAYKKQCFELKQKLLIVEKELANVTAERDEALKRLDLLTKAIKMLPL